MTPADRARLEQQATEIERELQDSQHRGEGATRSNISIIMAALVSVYELGKMVARRKAAYATTECPKCGVTFDHPTSQRRVYCSHQCAMAARKPTLCV